MTAVQAIPVFAEIVRAALEGNAEKVEGPGWEPVMLLCEWSLSTKTLKFKSEDVTGGHQLYQINGSSPLIDFVNCK